MAFVPALVALVLRGCIVLNNPFFDKLVYRGAIGLPLVLHPGGHHSERAVINDDLVHLTNGLVSTLGLVILDEHVVAIGPPVDADYFTEPIEVKSQLLILSLRVEVAHEHLGILPELVCVYDLFNLLVHTNI